MEANGTVHHCCYDKLLFSKAAAILGGKVRWMFTGSAPIDKQVLSFLKICFSCPIVEGYGLTESGASGTSMKPEDTIMGHVGGPGVTMKMRLRSIPDMDFNVTDKPYPRGELLLKGTSIFGGYYKMPEKTREAFDHDGWFCTGDAVQVFPNGSLMIIGRSKSIFKLS